MEVKTKKYLLKQAALHEVWFIQFILLLFAILVSNPRNCCLIWHETVFPACNDSVD